MASSTIFVQLIRILTRSDYFTKNNVTLNMIFSVTYYLELHNAISIYCSSHILPTNVELIIWTL